MKTSMPKIRGVAQFLGQGIMVHSAMECPGMPLITTHVNTPCVHTNTNQPTKGNCNETI